DYAHIALNQGKHAIEDPLLPPVISNPAGNIFSDNCDVNPEGDFSVQAWSEYIRYWYHESSVFHTEPICYNYIDPQSALALYTSKQEACPSRLGRPRELKKSLAEEGREGQDGFTDEYDATKDNGDSELLIAYLGNSSNSSSAKRDAL